MLDITGNSAIDVLIGLAFFYFLLSVLCSAINEGIATALNLRAKDLENGLRNLIKDPAGTTATLAALETDITTFYDNPRVKALWKPKRFLGKLFRNKKPSYISPRVFVLTLLDTFAPPGGGSPSNDLIARAQAIVDEATTNATVRGLLQDALDEAGGYRATFRAALERSFNEAMDRVSGWYKRRVQLILFGIALVVVVFVNADSFQVGKTLWQNDAVRSAVVARATAAVNQGNNKVCGVHSGSQSASPSDTPVQKVATCVSNVKQLGLPLGWYGAAALWDSHNHWHIPLNVLGKILGLLLTAFAILLGAPFWFDTLSKLAQLRGTGAAPGDKNSNASTAGA